MSLRDELQKIYDTQQKLTPPVVVNEASDPSSVLHHRFEWDDKVAGHKYRLVQAAELIRSVKITYAKSADGADKTVRAFVTTRSDADPANATYRPTEEIVADPLTRQMLLRECEREWRRFEAKYGHLEEFAQIVNGGEARAS